ncbi:MAG: ATP-binding cassette domain-containing protein [Lachnospiraceae bacterium]
MILSINNLEKSFDDNLIFKNCSFNIEEKEKAAIVGINGAGKSTLLKVIVRELSPDKGDIFTAKDKTLGYLAQYQDISSDNTIYEEMLDAKKTLVEMESKIRYMEEQMKILTGGELEELLTAYTNLTHRFELLNGYSYKSEIFGVLKGLGFGEDMYDKHISKLSGGQKTRVALGKMLLSNPDIILLDEPTNHLDIASISWLEGYLSSYNGAVVIVAHDRFFLDRIVTKVIEIDRTNVSVYMGNYSEYAKKKAARREAMMRQYLNQQREIKHQEEVIEKLRSFNREKSIKRAESREKLLNKMEILEKPDGDNKTMRLTLTPGIVSGNDVLTVDGLAKAFGSLTLFKNISFEIKRKERVAIIGENGSGKTTLLKIINGLLEADRGSISLGAKVHIGYYDQEHQLLDMENTVFGEISDEYPYLTNTEIRNMLAAFLFTGDDVFKLVSDLSGGERGRLSLTKLMLSEANFLILDEPTNHLDMDSKEILENALNSYEGTVLFVSHDRYFINTTATRILDLENGLLVNYAGNYDYYLEKHDHISNLALKNSGDDAVVKQTASQEYGGSDGKADWQNMKAKQALERKRHNDLKKTEEEIETIEERLTFLDNEMTKEEIYTSVSKCMEISREQDSLKERLNMLYESWEDLASHMS